MRVVSRSAIVVALSLLCGACGTHVRGTVTSFNDPSALAEGKTIAILPADKGVQSSLEFRAFAERIGNHLREKGYSVILPEDAPWSNPDQVAFLSYGIDDGRLETSTYSIPQWGVIGHSTQTYGNTSSYPGGATYSGTTTQTPQYGVTGYTTGVTTDTVYNRALFFQIHDAKRLKAKQPSRIYEAKVVSEGPCRNLQAVVPALIEILMDDFPGESGRTKKIMKPVDGSC